MLIHPPKGLKQVLHRLSRLTLERHKQTSGIWPVRRVPVGCTGAGRSLVGFSHRESRTSRGKATSRANGVAGALSGADDSLVLLDGADAGDVSGVTSPHTLCSKAASITASRSAWSITFSDPAVVASTLTASPAAGSSPHEKSNVTMSSRSTRSSPLMSAMHSQLSARPLALRSPASQRSRMLLKLQSVAVPEFKMTKYSSTVSHSVEIGRAAVSMEKKAKRLSEAPASV